MTKNITFVTTEFPPEPGGIGNHAYNLANQLVSKGYKIDLICDYRKVNRIYEDEFDAQLNFEVTRIKVTKPRFLMYFIRLWKINHSIMNSDIVIASGKFSLWIVALISMIQNKKCYAVIHGSEVNLRSKILKIITNISLKRYSKIIAVSNFTKSLISDLNLPYVTVIPNGFELFEENNLTNDENNKSKDSLNFITVGSITDRKGQLNFIEAIPKLLSSYPNLHYHMIGNPMEKGKILERIIDLGIDKNITIHGVVSDSQKQNILKMSDVFVMLSNNTATGDVEGFGIAILEANSLGIPAIGSEKCGIEDAIDNKHTGILVNPKNVNEIHDAVIEVIANFSFYKKNSKTWSENFSWELIGERYIKIIEA
ncbi:glycosyltransferase family 4 protein [Flavicella sp.]|uniref:glycosyltransferase family 4 protein n=1 Tax=Flavicella sp. TaxID=2957742 RepID=UPI0026228CF4|nr:glycosyltransferase family 4 protein [Flavicella sp.]MDG1804973.1 glycosyltransferase family 4 protein [Flavicella sp.]